MDKQVWTPEDLANLQMAWSSGKPYKVFMDLFHGRTWEGIRNAAWYHFGERPAHRMNMDSPSTIIVRRLLQKSDPLTAAEIAEQTNIATRTVMQILKEGRGTEFHVPSWKTAGHSKSQLWTFGPGEDAPRPPRDLPRDVQRKARLNRRARKLREGKVNRYVNPFATAMGLNTPSSVTQGRVFKQSMSIQDEEELAA